MAGEKIILAELDIDIQELLKDLQNGKEAMLALRKEQNELKKSGQEATAQFIANEAALKRESQAYRLKSELLSAQVGIGGKLENQQMAIAAAIDRSNNSEAEYRASNKELIALRRNLNINDDKYLENLNAINNRIDQNNDKIKEAVSAYEKQKINIGNYTQGVLEAYRAIEEEKAALEELNAELAVQRDALDQNSAEYQILNQQINQNITQINVYSNNLAEARGEQDEFTNALDLSSGGISGFIGKAREAGGAGPLLAKTFTAIRVGIMGAVQAGIAFLATPIGAAIGILAVTVGLVVGAFNFMKNAMNSTEEGSNKLAVVTASVSGIFQGLWKVIKPLGEWLGKAFLAYIESVGNALSWLTDQVANALDFLGMDETAESIRGVKSEIAAASKAALDLAKSEQELEKAQRKSKLTQLEYQKQAEKLRQQRDDETNSIPKRIELNRQLGEVLKKQLNDELAIAQLALRAADARVLAEGSTKEALDAQAAALTEIVDIQERITGQESEQLSNQNSLRKEAADAEKERQAELRAARQKALDDYTVKLNLELDIFLQVQGEKARSVEEEIALAEKTRQRKLEIAQAEYNASEKTANDKLALDKATNESTIEFMNAQRDAVLKNAEEEFRAFQDANKSKLDSNKFLNDTILNQELERIKNVAEAEKDLLRVKLGDTAAYLAEEQRINDEAKKQSDNLKLQREQAERDRKFADLENQKIIDEENFILQMESESKKLELQRQQEVLAAEKSAADVTLINQKYAKLQKDITKSVDDFKLQSRMDVISGIKNLFGQESKLGKALAVAEIVNTTVTNASKAFALAGSFAAEGLFPLAINARIQGALITATGAVQVAKTVGAKFEKGGLMEIGGKRHSAGGTIFRGTDGTTFEAEQGELIGVMNRNAATHFAAFNNAFPAGGSMAPNYFATGGVVSREIAQTEIDYDKLSWSVAAAMQNMPSPVVAVTDIIVEGGKYTRVIDNSRPTL